MSIAVSLLGNLTIAVSGAVDGDGVEPVAGAGEGEHLDAVVGVLEQVLQHRRHRRQPRDLGHGQAAGRRGRPGARGVEDLVALDDAVPVECSTVPFQSSICVFAF